MDLERSSDRVGASHNTQHTTHHPGVQTHSFEQIVLVILFTKLWRNPFPVENLRVQSTDVLVQGVHSQRNRLRAAKCGWLTHPGKRRTSRALRLLRRHYRSEAPCMAPKQAHDREGQPNEAEKKVQCGTCGNDSSIFAHKWTPGRSCRFCCSPFSKPVARAQSVGKRAAEDAGSSVAGHLRCCLYKGEGGAEGGEEGPG